MASRLNKYETRCSNKILNSKSLSHTQATAIDSPQDNRPTDAPFYTLYRGYPGIWYSRKPLGYEKRHAKPSDDDKSPVHQNVDEYDDDDNDEKFNTPTNVRKTNTAIARQSRSKIGGSSALRAFSIRNDDGWMRRWENSNDLGGRCSFISIHRYRITRNGKKTSPCGSLFGQRSQRAVVL